MRRKLETGAINHALDFLMVECADTHVNVNIPRRGLGIRVA